MGELLGADEGSDSDHFLAFGDAPENEQETVSAPTGELLGSDDTADFPNMACARGHGGK